MTDLAGSVSRGARTILRPFYRPVKRVTRFIAWAIPTLSGLLAPSRRADRVLIIYDTSSQPFSIGDLLIFQEASLLLCEKFGIRTVDFALIYDREDPASSDPVFKTRVTKDNFLYHLASVIPVVQVNQFLGSIFVFDSRAQLARYVNDNLDRYVVWPSGWNLSSREYLSPSVFNQLLREHFEQHGSVPRLSCRPFLRDWAIGFYRDQTSARVPITVNLRNNPGWHLDRNSRIDIWITFFEDCAPKYPALFVIICARSEVDDRLRQCKNVLIAKDYDTGVEQDMALIHYSAAHMGASSGPATMAWFNDRPYLMVNTEFKAGEFFSGKDMVEQVGANLQRVWFSSPMQHVAAGVETAELLITQFASLWSAIDLAPWSGDRTPQSPNPGAVTSWLR